MQAFAPLAKSVLGSKSISLKRRIRLGWTLVVTRLTFNLHTWSKFNGKARAIINIMYMRLWRRIIGDPKYKKPRLSDKQVREELGVPSLDCFVRKRRLKYLSRLARSQSDALHAILQGVGKHGENMPWVDLVISDLQTLRAHSNGKLSELVNPILIFAALLGHRQRFPEPVESNRRLVYRAHRRLGPFHYGGYPGDL